MEKPKRKFLNDRKEQLAMLVGAGPFLGTGLMLTTIGFRIAYLVPAAGRPIIQTAFWLLFLAMVLLNTEHYWDFVLFLLVGLMAGLILFWLNGGRLDSRVWILLAVLILISTTGSGLFQRYSRWGNRALTIIWLLFTLGWILLQFFRLPDRVELIWIILGLILFTVSLISMITNEDDKNRTNSAISLSIRLFMALFYLFWLSSRLWITIDQLSFFQRYVTNLV